MDLFIIYMLLLLEKMNVKVFNLVSSVSKTRFLVQHEFCKRKCRLDGNVCSLEQKWNHNTCRSECK